MGGNLYFLLSDVDNGTELWSSDGTLANTGLLKDISPGAASSGVAFLTDINGQLYFRANDGINGAELWRSDGTSDETVQVADVSPGLGGSNPIPMFDLGGHIFAMASGPGVGAEIYISNTTPTDISLSRTALNEDLAIGSAVAMLSAIDADSIDTHSFALVEGDGDDDNSSFAIIGNQLITATGLDFETKPTFAIRIASTDQIGATVEKSLKLSVYSSQLLKDIHPGTPSANPANFTQVGTKRFFSATSPDAGSGLWMTDGTEAGTTLVKQFVPGHGLSGLRELTNFNNALYFVSNDLDDGAELWKSDGTLGGTVKVKDIASGELGSEPSLLTPVGNLLFFVADDGSGRRMWRTDGSELGTFSVGETGTAAEGNLVELTEVDGTLFFAAAGHDGDVELWKSNGSHLGTEQVKNIFDGSSSFPRELTSNGSDLFFVATDATYGDALWISDGTSAGTQLVKDIRSDSGSASIAEVTSVNGTIFFRGNDGIHGVELWVTNGTEAGTQLVRDLAVGSDGGDPSQLINIGGNLVFVADHGVYGRELWQSDGTEAGTILIKDTLVGSEGSQPHNLTNIDGELFFSANDGIHGAEQWRANFETGVISLIADLTDDSSSSIPAAAFIAGGKLISVAENPTQGRELFLVALNNNPSAINLSNTLIDENSAVGTPIGIFSAEDVNLNDFHTFTLVTGEGSDDNSHFAIQGKELRTAANLDYETNHDFTIRIRATDQLGLSFERSFEITVADLPELDWAGFELLQDTNSTLTSEGSDPENFVTVGNQVFFTASTKTKGRVLWVTDGTDEGTRIVMGAPASNFSQSTVVGNKLYYFNSSQLYVTDGTEEGTLHLSNVNVNGLLSEPSRLVEYDGQLYFSAQGIDPVLPTGLWRTDGTIAGTSLVTAAGSRPYELTVVNDKLFFNRGQEFWSYDAATDVANQVKDTNPTGADRPHNLTVVSAPDGLGGITEKLFFAAWDGVHGIELWVSDGTESGTYMVRDIADENNSGSPSDISQLTNINGTLYFSADDGVNGVELWKSDGTEAGTLMVSNIHPTGDSDPAWITAFDGAVYFAADDGTHGVELWKTDSTGTSLVMDINQPYSNDLKPSASPAELTVFDNKLYFNATNGARTATIHNGLELWVLDDSETEPRLAVEFIALVNGGDPTGITVATLPTIDGLLEQTLVFAARDSRSGNEIFKSDGTPENTFMIKDIVSGTGDSDPLSLTKSGGLLFYSGLHPNLSRELYVSDGRSEGTGLLKDIYQGGTSSGVTQLTDVNDRLFFAANQQSWGVELWTSDGTVEGTVMVKDINVQPNGNRTQSSSPASLTAVGNRLFFTADDGTLGSNGNRELWVSDGTELGTYLVKDFTPDGGNSRVENMTNVDGTLFFTTNDTVGTNQKLWKSDGTEAGTVLLKDSYPDGVATIVRQLISVTETDNLGGTTSTLFFFDREPVMGFYQLWKSDGTVAGTSQLTNFDSAAWPFENMADVDGTLFFSSGSFDTLWKSDGTPEGTVLVKEFEYVFQSASPRLQEFTAIGDTVYFSAILPEGQTGLWKSDGTAAGTVRVHELFPTNLTNIEGTLYFTADDGVNGQELWKTDGTSEGTGIAANFTGESGGGSSPSQITAVGGNIFVVATTEAFGTELYGVFGNFTKPTFSITSTDQTVDEGIGYVTVTATLDMQVDFPIRVPVLLNSGSATLGADFDRLGTELVFS